ncbi:hypothetical protein V8C86DRAFT_3170790, partial [Haematococcus lacustris]
MLRNTSEVLELHFGVAAVRAQLVNVNVSLAAPEVAHVLGLSQASLLVADVEFEGVLREAVRLAEAAAAAEPGQQQGGGLALRQQLRAAALAAADRPWFDVNEGYQMYFTSGTTGLPKAVLLSHKIVALHALATIKEMHLHGGDVWGHFAPLFHLVDVFAVYAITLVAGRHVLLPNFSAAQMLLAMERERVSVTNIAASMGALMMSQPGLPVTDLSSLRVVSFGGSPQPPAVVRGLAAALGCEVFCSYGMTECCGKISMSILHQDWPTQQLLDLVCSSGRPFILMNIKVGGSSSGHEVQPGSGQVGEVWCMGPTVFSGYVGNAKANAEAFVTSGQGAGAAGAWFKTGDLALVRADGYLQVVDRAKDMILCGGENVYCAEVESVLQAHPLVAQAAVYGVPNPVMGEMVMAAVVLKPGNRQEAGPGAGPVAAPAQQLLAWCRQRLAHYKVPMRVHVMPQLPMTGTGKVSKVQLR